MDQPFQVLYIKCASICSHCLCHEVRSELLSLCQEFWELARKTIMREKGEGYEAL